jgi:hypothetical protein
LTSERNVKLIILDSLAHPIRSIVDGDHLTRYKYTVRIVTLLQKLASDYKCAVGLVLLFEIISIRFLRLLLLII